MARFTNMLEHVRVAAPCPADWEQMRGTEQVRFCEQCSLNVYNLSDMTRKDAETLIMKTEGRLCVRFYRRADGTIITSNCPVGLAAIRRRASRIVRAALSTVLTFLAGLGVFAAMGKSSFLNDYGRNLIAPVPLEEAKPQPPATVMGTFAFIAPRGQWVQGKARPEYLRNRDR